MQFLLASTSFSTAYRVNYMCITGPSAAHIAVSDELPSKLTLAILYGAGYVMQTSKCTNPALWYKWTEVIPQHCGKKCVKVSPY